MNFIYFIKNKLNEIVSKKNYIILKFIIIWLFLFLIILILYYFLIQDNTKYFVNPDINNYTYHLNDNDMIKIKNNLDNDFFNKNYFYDNIGKVKDTSLNTSYHNNINPFSKDTNNDINLNNILNYVNSFPKNNYNDDFNIEI